LFGRPMPGNAVPWTGTQKLFAGIGVLVAALTTLLVVAMMRGPSDDPRKDSIPDSGETSSGPTTPSPASDPSSGPTEVPPPGSLETVDVGEVSVAPAVALDETGDFGTGVTLRITDIRAVDGVARGPGQVSGPALRLELVAHNDSAKSVSLEGMVVALAYGAADTPAMPLDEPGAQPFGGAVSVQDDAAAVYVFAIPEGYRSRVAVSASYTGSAPTVLFEGDALRLSQ